MTRVTDKLVENWLVWCRNHGEIVGWSSGKYFARLPKGTTRRWRIRLPFAVTANGDPFRAKQGLVDLMGHAPEDVVPGELMLTSREALLFGMGCAVGRTAALIGPEHDWQRERLEEWTPEVRQAWAEQRTEAREANQADLKREQDQRQAEREARGEAYRRQRELAAQRSLEEGNQS